MHPERFLLARGVVPPELFEDALGRHHPVDVQEEKGEERARLSGGPRSTGSPSDRTSSGPRIRNSITRAAIELTPTYSELNDLEAHVKWGSPSAFRASRSPRVMTMNPQKSFRASLRAAAVIAAVASVLCARAVDASAQSAARPAAGTTLEARPIAELKAIAEWAREQGLTGLSPASLRAVDEG